MFEYRYTTIKLVSYDHILISDHKEFPLKNKNIIHNYFFMFMCHCIIKLLSKYIINNIIDLIIISTIYMLLFKFYKAIITMELHTMQLQLCNYLNFTGNYNYGITCNAITTLCNYLNFTRHL